MVQVYGIKNCDSVKKALRFFKQHNIAYELFDFKEKPLDCQKIETWLQKLPIEKIFNARSTTYRTLKLKELNLDELGKKKWLCKENMLIKRPIVEYKNTLTVGFNEEEYSRRFI
jgi:Spx/MgsR family transcriptional regulator